MNFQLSADDIQRLRSHKLFIKLVNHVFEFMDDMKIWPKSGVGLISLSGGADSILLTLVLKEALLRNKIKMLKCIHFNHGTRCDNDEEAVFVSNFCENLEIPVEVINLEMNSMNSNFENNARIKRNKYFSKSLKDGELVYLGHHIDDSQEWSLMQQCKSSSLSNSLGIPVVNANKARPFMCLTSKQIRNLLKVFKVQYIIDPTNSSDAYERNWFRNHIFKKLNSSYPSALKNYVTRSNQLAHELGLHRTKSNTDQWTRFQDEMGGVGVYSVKRNPHFEGGKEWLVDLIKEVSTADRGKLRDQVDKMIKASLKGKKGPMKFSGGVLGFMDKGVFYFQHVDKLSEISSLDKKLAQYISTADIPCGTHKLFEKPAIPKSLVFPYLIMSKDKSAKKVFGPGLNAPHFLFPKSCKELLEKNIYFQTFNRAIHYKMRNKSSKRDVSSLFVEDLLKS
ncbi:MAG: tRNA lysidine(34) synthetase TilS [Bacteriovoracaceae bacterium]|nr:tRNA lysidine(34) synthetase TilS [Bacteriovoracaceae bacterium]